MPIKGQIVKFKGSEPHGLELDHQSLMTEVSSVVDDWTRNKKYFVGVFLSNFLQKESLLLEGQIVDALEGCDHVVPLEGRL